MGIAERREREKEQRRNDIVDAAERVFFAKGHQDATMDEVAEEAELSKGTIYLYFKNKEELYLALHLRGLNILAKMFEEAVNNTSLGIDKVYDVGRAYYLFSKEYPNYFNVMIYYESHEVNYEEKDSIAAQCAEEGSKTLGLLIEAIKAGIADGSIREDVDPLKMAAILWGETSGLIQLIAIHGEILNQKFNINSEELIDYAYEFIINSLKR